MRFIRLLIISFILLFGVITALSLFIPSRVRISRAVNIKAGPEMIRTQIADMRNWKKWNPFFANVPDSSFGQTGTSNALVDSMTLNGTHIRWEKKDTEELIASMNRPDRNPVLNGWQILSLPGSDSTTVQWYMDFKLKWYPWEKLGSLMFEKSYGPKLEQGLGALRRQVEADRISQ